MSDDVPQAAEDAKKGLVDFFVESYERLRERHYARRRKNKALIGFELAASRSDVVDELVRKALAEYGHSELPGVSVVALGGYGRRELCPYSDIDLLFLYAEGSKDLAEEVIEKLLYLLWDLRLDIGNCMRSVEECAELSMDRSDTTILSSLLDGRFVCGDADLYAGLEREIYGEVLPKISGDFVRRKIEERERQAEKHGQTLYLLEPNVKEGKGGLREFQAAMWIAQAHYKAGSFEEVLQRGFVSEKEYRVIRKCVNFLLLVRAEIHYQAARRQDNLSFEFQEAAAKSFGYKDGKLRAVEKFMRIYYLRAAVVTQQSRRVIEKCTRSYARRRTARKTVHLDHGFTIQGDRLSVTSRNVFREDVRNFVRAFELADRHGLEFSEHMEFLMSEQVTLVDEKVRNDPEFNSIFRRLLRFGKNVSKMLFKMNDIRLLGRFVPEFGKIVCMVQYNSYHIYTVDVHSIFMVREIERLTSYRYEKEFPFLTKVAESLVKKHVLFLACLFHDMGKGRGGSHAQKGAAMIPKIAGRMGLGEADAGQLEFLVRHHLAMVHFSQRRDISDPVVIKRFAKSFHDEETLSLLYLLTFADIRSVGPDVWTDWTGLLLQELYIRTLREMSGATYGKRTDEERARRVTEDVAAGAEGEISEGEVKEILSRMPVSYFRGFSKNSVARHARFLAGLDGEFGMDVVRYQGYSEVTIVAPDEKGIFSVFCGILSANGLNILGARIVTTLDGKAFDTFYVDKADSSLPEEDEETWEKVRASLGMVLEGRADVAELVERRRRNYRSYGRKVPEYPPEIAFDGDSSDAATVIEVYANDRVGLLYDVTRTISELGLSVDYAKISTRADQVADAFYVRDSEGRKIDDRGRLEEIENALIAAVS